MRPLSYAILALLLTPLAGTAQTSDDAAPLPSPSPVVSLTVDGVSGLPLLGVWKPLTERLTLGLELESDVMSSTFFPNGDPSRGIHRRYWRFAFGPTVSFRLASLGRVSLLSYGGVSYGIHAFDAPKNPGDLSYLGERGVGVRGGLGLDWRTSDHWTLGATFLRRWTSDPGTIDDILRSAWRGPKLGLSVKFHF